MGPQGWLEECGGGERKERDRKGKLSAEGGDNLKLRKKRVSLLVGASD